RRGTMLWAEGPGVASIARLPGADPDVAGRTAAELSFVLAVECVRTALRCELPPTAEEIASIADLADAAHTACPDVLITRRALAMTRLLQGLPDQARTLLIGLSRAGERPLTIATADAVRAVAEAEAGDP